MDINYSLIFWIAILGGGLGFFIWCLGGGKSTTEEQPLSWDERTLSWRLLLERLVWPPGVSAGAFLAYHLLTRTPRGASWEQVWSLTDPILFQITVICATLWGLARFGLTARHEVLEARQVQTLETKARKIAVRVGMTTAMLLIGGLIIFNKDGESLWLYVLCLDMVVILFAQILGASPYAASGVTTAMQFQAIWRGEPVALPSQDDAAPPATAAEKNETRSPPSLTLGEEQAFCYRRYLLGSAIALSLILFIASAFFCYANFNHRIFLNRWTISMMIAALGFAFGAYNSEFCIRRFRVLSAWPISAEDKAAARKRTARTMLALAGALWLLLSWVDVFTQYRLWWLAPASFLPLALWWGLDRPKPRK